MKNDGFAESYAMPVSEGRTPGIRILFRMLSIDDALLFPVMPGVPAVPVVPVVVVDGVGWPPDGEDDGIGEIICGGMSNMGQSGLGLLVLLSRVVLPM
jgi:hypothetical protein